MLKCYRFCSATEKELLLLLVDIEALDAELHVAVNVGRKQSGTLWSVDDFPLDKLAAIRRIYDLCRYKDSRAIKTETAESKLSFFSAL